MVSLKLMGGFHFATVDTAPESFTTALLRKGTEPCPAVPRAVSVMARGIFSSVWIEANVTLPFSRLKLPPSARQYSASIFGKRSDSVMWAMPYFTAPSSPASKSATTSRSSGRFWRLSSSSVISVAATLSLSSTVPRP